MKNKVYVLLGEKEQIQYCISMECSKCTMFEKSSETQNCKYLSSKIDELNNDERYGKMSGKAKKKMWHFRNGASRGTQKGRRKRHC